MKKINILFLGGAKRVSLAEEFIKSGKKRNLEISIFSYEIQENTPISFIGKIIKGRKWTDSDILNDLEEVVISEKIDLLIPNVDPATNIAASFKNYTKTNCYISVPDVKLCDIFFNKQLTYNWCLENEIPVPSSNINFPMIAKPVNGSASVGIYKISNQLEYDEFQTKHNINNYNIQKFIDGIEYSVDVYVANKSKNVIVSVPRIRLEVLGGEAVKSITKRDLKLIEISKDIAIKSGLTGAMVIQFIQDKFTGQNYLMEINPRLGGAVLCSIGAGADFPGYILDEMLGKELIESNELWEDNILMVRRFSEFFIKK
jgi:carbamoyl-phosphate synthase large subunit